MVTDGIPFDRVRAALERLCAAGEAATVACKELEAVTRALADEISKGAK